MDNIFSDMDQMMDALTEPLGDAAPRRRHLMADYKDAGGRDYHRELMSWHSPGAADEALVGSVRAELAGRGYKLTALAERTAGGTWRVLYLAPGCLEEYAAEAGRTMPADIAV